MDRRLDSLRGSEGIKRRSRSTRNFSVRMGRREELKQARREAREAFDRTVICEQAARIPDIFNEITSGDPNRIKEACRSLRDLLAHDDIGPYQEMMNLGMIPVLLQLIRDSDDDAVIFDALWAITNMASASSEYTIHIVSSGVITAVIDLANGTDNNYILEQCVWLLSNIAGDGSTMRNAVLREEGMLVCIYALDSAMEEHRFDTVHIALWAIANLCRSKPAPYFSWVKPVIPSLCRVIRHAQTNFKTQATWALSYLTDVDNPAYISDIVQTDICLTVLDALRTQAYDPCPCLRLLGNIATGVRSDVEHLVSIGTLNVLRDLIDVLQGRALTQLIWAISNICAANVEHLQFVLDHEIHRKLIKFLNSDRADVRLETGWVFANSLLIGTPPQVQAIVDLDIIPALAEMLLSANDFIVELALDSIAGILRSGADAAAEDETENEMIVRMEECRVKDYIDRLRARRTNYIFYKSDNVYKTYFAGEDALSDDELFNADRFDDDEDTDEIDF